MEESSNGRLEELLKVEAHDEGKEVEDCAASKPQVEFATNIIADGSSTSVTVHSDGEDSSSSSRSLDEEAEAVERSSQVENSENVEVEKLVSDSVVESVQLEHEVFSTEELNQDIKPSVEKSDDSDVAELDGKETEEKITPFLDETNPDSPILTDLLINGLKEETQRLSSSATTWDSANVVSGGIEETTIPCLAENAEAPEVAVETRDGGELVNKPEIPESTGIQPIISLSHHPVQPTSWKSCCGLFEILQHSDG
ncbi:hypothetical protein DITRI_Ditri16bG0100600 [Diplodiscus trichospermus]